MQPCNSAADRPFLLSGQDADQAHCPPWSAHEFHRLLERAAALRRYGFSTIDADDLAEWMLLEDRLAR